MKKSDKEILAKAAGIIMNELITNDDVRIPGFGKFYKSMVRCTRDRPDDDYGSFNMDHLVTTIKFKPFGLLKHVFRNIRKACGNRSHYNQCILECNHASPCVDRDGDELGFDQYGQLRKKKYIRQP